jgi:ribosomal protein L7/L12
MDIPSWAVGGLIVIAFVLGRVSATPPAATPSRTLPPSSPIDVAAADAEIATLIQAGRTIDAIKRYRTVHGVDLKAAKDAIDALVARRVP